MRNIMSEMSGAIEEAFSNKYRKLSNKEILKEFISEESLYIKARSLLSLVANNIPGAVSESVYGLFQKKYDMTQLPFDFSRYQVPDRIDRGRHSEIFILSPRREGDEAYVFKVVLFPPESVDMLVGYAKKFNEEHDTIMRWYGGVPDLVPWESSFVSSGPHDDERTVVTVQRFEGHDLQDIFRNFTGEELVLLLYESPELLESFRNFVRITREIDQKEGKIIDLYGKSNLIISNSAGNTKRLRLIDTHDIISKENMRGYKTQVIKLEYLENILRSFDEKMYNKV